MGMVWAVTPCNPRMGHAFLDIKPPAATTRDANDGSVLREGREGYQSGMDVHAPKGIHCVQNAMDGSTDGSDRGIAITLLELKSGCAPMTEGTALQNYEGSWMDAMM